MRRVEGAEGKKKGGKNRIRCEEREEKALMFGRISCRLTAMITTVLSANAVITTFCKMFSWKEMEIPVNVAAV